ncbi:MAG: SpoVR family protein [Planctomycetota bacterium]|nr:MAG: SpoVR family protein [Planctomycetota bacterium]
MATAADVLRKEEIPDLQAEIEAHARSYGLDFFDTIFELVDYEELCMIAAYGGFPIRYPHWRFGAAYDELMKGYTYGLQKIYELVINTDPCYAYLMSCNSRTDQKLVMAHVYGHCDFFKNNAWFQHTNRKMLDEMANHAARVHRHIDRLGFDRVEEFIDVCLSLENLIDPYSPHIRRKRSETDSEPRMETVGTAGRFPAKSYMDAFINPPEVLEKLAEKRRAELLELNERGTFPEEPTRDVLLFLLEHAPLRAWEHDILSIVRDEAYYFAPQAQTKIMNEGWASYWHSTIMTRHGLTDREVIDYADHHSGTLAMSPTRLNPYKLGIELFRDIEERWNKGRFGAEWEACDDLRKKEKWDLELGLGRQKIFEVRRVHNDVTFIDTFLTPEFCRKHRLFSFAYNDSTEYYEIASREFAEIKKQLLQNLTNRGQPIIYVVDGNFRNRGELLLRHEFVGIELKLDYARDTLTNLEKLWRRPVHIETVVDEREVRISCENGVHDINTV